MSLGLATRGVLGGLGSGGGVPVPVDGTPLLVVSTAVEPTRVTLVFNVQPVLVSALGWTIEGLAVTGVALGAAGTNSVLVSTVEQRGGASYTLVIPSGGLRSGDGGAVVPESRSVPFVGKGEAPHVVSVASEAGYALLVTFSEPLQVQGMLALKNYKVSPYTLRLQRVEQVSDRQVRLVTSRQQPGVRYVLTASGMKDLAGNPLVVRTAAI
jgi:hypothetical protein